MMTIITPLLLAAVSGLAFLAVKHPSIYEKLFNKLYITSSIIFIVLIGWNVSVQFTFRALLPFVELEKANAAKAAAEALSIPGEWLIPGQLGVMGYLFFLSWLAHQIMQDKHTKDDKP